MAQTIFSEWTKTNFCFGLIKLRSKEAIRLANSIGPIIQKTHFKIRFFKGLQHLIKKVTKKQKLLKLSSKFIPLK